MCEGDAIGEDIHDLHLALFVFVFLPLLSHHLGHHLFYAGGVLVEFRTRWAIGAHHRDIAVLTAEDTEQQPLAVGRKARRAVLGGVVVVGQIN